MRHAVHLNNPPSLSTSLSRPLLVRMSLPEPLLLPGPAHGDQCCGQGRQGGGGQGAGLLGQGGQLQVCRLLPDRVLRESRPNQHCSDDRQDQQEQEELRH